MVNLVPLDVPSQKASKQSHASTISSLRFSGAIYITLQAITKVDITNTTTIPKHPLLEDVISKS